MAWMFVVNGASLRVEEVHAYEFRDALESKDAFKEIEKKAQEIDKEFIVKVAPDPDISTVCVLIGKEILEGRHVSQGQTTLCPLWNTDDIRKKAAPLVDEMTEVLMSVGAGIVDEGWGIVVNVFD